MARGGKPPLSSKPPPIHPPPKVTPPKPKPPTKPTPPKKPTPPPNGTAPPPSGGWGGVTGAVGGGLLAGGAMFLPNLITAGRDAGLGAIAGDTAKDVFKTLTEGVENIVETLSSNPMVIGAALAGVAIIAFAGSKKA
jgi:hypothetical protein